MPKTKDFVAKLAVFSLQRHPLQSVWPWASYLTGEWGGRGMALNDLINPRFLKQYLAHSDCFKHVSLIPLPQPSSRVHIKSPLPPSLTSPPKLGKCREQVTQQKVVTINKRKVWFSCRYYTLGRVIKGWLPSNALPHFGPENLLLSNIISVPPQIWIEPNDWKPKLKRVNGGGALRKIPEIESRENQALSDAASPYSRCTW